MQNQKHGTPDVTQQVGSSCEQVTCSCGGGVGGAGLVSLTGRVGAHLEKQVHQQTPTHRYQAVAARCYLTCWTPPAPAVVAVLVVPVSWVSQGGLEQTSVTTASSVTSQTADYSSD